MDGMIDPVHRLQRRQIGESLLDGCGIEREAPRDRRRRPDDIGDVLHTAEAAAGAPFDGAGGARLEGRRIDRDIDTEAILDGECYHIADGRGIADEAFRQRKADGEILEIGRRRHHHRGRDGVMHDRNWHFLRHLPDQRRLAAIGAIETALGRPRRRGLGRPNRVGPCRHIVTPLRQAASMQRACARSRAAPIRPATRRAGWTGSPGPRSPCIPGSWSPSRNVRW